MVWDTRAVVGVSGGPVWSAARDAWLESASPILTDDPRVVAWGLVGSFGRGEADEWSDLDLLVVTRDADFADIITREHNDRWLTADLFIDARRNVPSGATSAATVHVEAGVPVGVDWYVYPHAMAAWPSDCRVRNGAGRVPPAGEDFATWNGRGPRTSALDTTPAAAVHARLAMIVVAGRYIARSSPLAQAALELVGARPSDAVPARQLDALRELLEHTAPSCPAVFRAIIDEYLALVAMSISETPSS